MKTHKGRFSYLFLVGLLLHVIGVLVLNFPSLSSAQTGAGWKEKWDKTLAGAKKESTVVVFGPAGQQIREAVTQGFRKAFPDISLEYTGGRESEFGAKIQAERNGGIYSVDVAFSGPSLAHLYLNPIKALEPVEPALILPEVTTLKNWRDNQIHFSDAEAKYNLVFLGQLSPPIAYDPKLKAEEVDELNDLLHPKWKGKIVINNPIPPGAGHSFFRWLWRVLGREKATDYFKNLRAQAGTVDRDERRQLEWVAQGKYAINVAPGGTQINQLINSGVKFGVLAELKEINTWLTSGPGTVMLINKAPHPNAAVIFINWILSRDGQIAISKALNSVSRRLDVPTEHLPAYMVPRPGVKYWQSYVEAVLRRAEDEEKVIQDLFGR